MCHSDDTGLRKLINGSCSLVDRLVKQNGVLFESAFEMLYGIDR